MEINVKKQIKKTKKQKIFAKFFDLLYIRYV